MSSTNLHFAHSHFHLFGLCFICYTLLEPNLINLQVLQYLLDDVSDFLSTQCSTMEGTTDVMKEDKGCTNLLKAFIDYITEREKENFRTRRHDNENSVTLTTIHQVLPKPQLIQFNKHHQICQ